MPYRVSLFCCSQFLLVVRMPFVRNRRRTGQPVADDVLISATTYLLKLKWLVRKDSQTNHHEKVLVHLRSVRLGLLGRELLGNSTGIVFETVERHLSILADLDEVAVGIPHIATPFPTVIV